MTPALSKEFPDIQANYRVSIHSKKLVEKLVRDVIITYSQTASTSDSVAKILDYLTAAVREEEKPVVSNKVNNFFPEDSAEFSA